MFTWTGIRHETLKKFDDFYGKDTSAYSSCSMVYKGTDVLFLDFDQKGHIQKH